MIFEKKKIQIETLSEYLTSVRENLKLSAFEVAKKTGIKLKFLNGLESGNFKDLPANVYVLGFLKELAGLYSIDGNELIEQYKKERAILEQVFKHNLYFEKAWHKNFFQKLVITPKILSLFLGLAFVAISVAYIVWQVWSINKTPSLQVFTPLNNAVINGAVLQVLGRTDPGMTLTVNDQNVFVDNKGGFQAEIGITPGPKEIDIIAENRFGKSASQTLNITGASTLVASSSQLTLKIDFAAPVNLVFSIDDLPPQNLSFNSGDSKTFTASQKILLSTSNAGATLITLNGQSMGAMGKSKEPLNNIDFFAQSSSIKSPSSTAK